jgi:hypothetical protein
VIDMKAHIELYAETMDARSKIRAHQWLTEQLVVMDKFILQLKKHAYDGLDLFIKDREDLQILLNRVDVSSKL